MAENSLTSSGASYSPSVGVIYVFNLIVGTGALTMPKAFDAGGWLLSTIVITILAFMSFLTVTYVIEAMAGANAIRQHRRTSESQVNPGLSASISESSPLLASDGRSTDNAFEIVDRIEMGQMASMFYNKVGAKLFYASLIIYLYGDLAIYAAAMPKSLRNVICRYNPDYNSTSCRGELSDDVRCWASVYLTRMDVYRICVALFALLLAPFLFSNVQKTKYLQLFTTAMRWFSFISMVVFASIVLSKHEGTGHPDVASFTGVPTLFGVSIYSFMCHHSLPSLVTPIAQKSKLTVLFACDYLLILMFYCVLAYTGVFSTSNVLDLYTLNFQPPTCAHPAGDGPLTDISFFQYFLALFPVIVLSTNFPIIGITLRNNLKTLFLHGNHQDQNDSTAWERWLFPLATLVVPFAVAMGTNHVDVLVGFTGSYAGAIIQYVVPVTLAYFCRKQVVMFYGDADCNTHRSPFRHGAWMVFVLSWAVLCVVLVTVNHIMGQAEHKHGNHNSTDI